MNRYKDSGLSLDDLRQMPASKVVDLIYPKEKLRHKDIPLPDFEKIHEQMIQMGKHALDKCRDLFEVLDTRDGRKSTVVISRFPVSTWFDMFADNTYADACLTRITDKHHTYRLEMNGINMRETE